MTDTKGTVFIIDDDASVRRGLTRLLRGANFEVEAFDGAESYVARPEFHGLGCIVLDIAMPGITGTELQEGFVESGQQLPIIFLTGHGDIPLAVQAMKLGAVDFLSKPVDEDALFQAIAEAHDRHGAIRSARSAEAAIRARLESLTPREFQVLRCLIVGSLNKQIAVRLGIAEKTVKVHRGRVIAKMNAPSIAELVRMCGEVNVAPDPGR